MLLSRVRGSLVAAVVGDCIGEMFEGSAHVRVKTLMKEVNKIEKRWSEANQKTESETEKSQVPQLSFTDDTAMARSIAASLVEHRSVNVKDIASRFSKEYAREPYRGYGGNVITVLIALGDTNLADIYRPASEQFDGSGSYGNGGGMRIAPLGLFCYKQSLDELKEYAVKVTRLTHSHPHAIVGALLQSLAVHLALTLAMSLTPAQSFDPANFLQQLLERLKPLEEEVYRKHRHMRKGVDDSDEKGDVEKSEKQDLPYCAKLEVMKEFLTRDVSVEEVDDKLGTNISALDSVPTAVYCFLKGCSKSIPEFEGRSEVEQTILYAISLGGDTDTIATMAGAIAGAVYGLEAVPQAWQDSCEGVRDAMDYADKMVEIFTNTDRA